MECSANEKVAVPHGAAPCESISSCDATRISTARLKFTAFLKMQW